MGQRICTCDDDCSQDARGKDFQKLPPDSGGLSDNLLLAEVEELKNVMAAKDAKIRQLERDLVSARDTGSARGQSGLNHAGGAAADDAEAEDRAAMAEALSDHAVSPPPMPPPPKSGDGGDGGPATVTRAPDTGILSVPVALEKDASGRLGLQSIPAGDGGSTLLVTDVEEVDTPIGLWNDRQRQGGQPEAALERGDRIASVNGVQGDMLHMTSLLLREASLELAVERWPAIVVVQLQKHTANDKYGMQMELVQKSSLERILRVTRIAQVGLLGDWNRSAAAAGRFHEVIAAASEIVRVGDETEPEAMQNALAAREGAELTFKRPDPSILKKMSLQHPSGSLK